MLRRVCFKAFWKELGKTIGWATYITAWKKCGNNISLAWQCVSRSIYQGEVRTRFASHRVAYNRELQMRLSSKPNRGEQHALQFYTWLCSSRFRTSRNLVLSAFSNFGSKSCFADQTIPVAWPVPSVYHSGKSINSENNCSHCVQLHQTFLRVSFGGGAIKTTVFTLDTFSTSVPFRLVVE